MVLTSHICSTIETVSEITDVLGVVRLWGAHYLDYTETTRTVSYIVPFTGEPKSLCKVPHIIHGRERKEECEVEARGESERRKGRVLDKPVVVVVVEVKVVLLRILLLAPYRVKTTVLFPCDSSLLLMVRGN